VLGSASELSSAPWRGGSSASLRAQTGWRSPKDFHFVSQEQLAEILRIQPQKADPWLGSEAHSPLGTIEANDVRIASSVGKEHGAALSFRSTGTLKVTQCQAISIWANICVRSGPQDGTHSALGKHKEDPATSYI
jgi:hypothetical protein